MSCQRCKSKRIASVFGKYSKVGELFGSTVLGRTFEEYIPTDIGVADGTDLDFTWCLECGQMQGKFPIEQSHVEEMILDGPEKE